MNNTISRFLISSILLLFGFSGCKKNKYSRYDAPNMHAYGRVWKHYVITRWETTYPLMSGHGPLIPQEMEYGTRYLESDTGEKINIDQNLYAVHANGAILPFPNGPNDQGLYVYIPLFNYNDRIYFYKEESGFRLFPDCNQMYIEEKPDLIINLGKAYKFLGEFDPVTKRFILDRVLPVPASDKRDSEFMRLHNGKPEIDISVMVEKSEKYVCK